MVRIEALYRAYCRVLIMSTTFNEVIPLAFTDVDENHSIFVQYILLATLTASGIVELLSSLDFPFSIM